MNPAAVLNILIQVQGASQASSQINSINNAGGGAHKTLGKLVKGAGLAGAALGGVLAKGAFDAVSAFNESNKIAKQTESVLKSTGNAAGVTAKQVNDLASAISKKTGVDDEAIQSGENLLLTFTNLKNGVGKGNDIFNQTTKIMTDMSVALGQDTKSSALQLGKALNDPVKGVSALQRVGVSFTASQKKQIKTLVDSGKTMDAQKLILKELGKEFGGSAEAQATAGDKLKVTFGNLQELIGSKLAPAFEKAATFLTKFIDGMSTGEGPGGRFVQTLKDIAAAFQDVLAWGERNKTLLTDIALLTGTAVAAFTAYKIAVGLNAIATVAWTVATTALGTAAAVARAPMLALALAFQANPVMLIVTALAALVAGIILAYRHSETFRDIVNGVWNAIKTVAQPVIEWLATALPDAWEAIKTATTAVWDFLKPYLTVAFQIIKTAVVTYFKVYWTIIKGVWDAIKAVTTTLWDWFGPYVKAVWELIKTAVTTYFNAYKTIISGVWTAIKAAATVAWAAIKFAIINPLQETKKTIGEVWDGIKTTVEKVWDKLKTAAGTFAGGLKDAITDAFRDAANLVIGFVNKIIDVVNKIPGVELKHVPKLGDDAKGLARGGAFARTGGMVNSPMTFMGEEAPRHPEFVIPTNPAYRKRAVGLLGQAAGALGFATGGINVADYNHVYPSHVGAVTGAARLSPSVVKAIAESQGLPGTAFEQIAHGESNYYPGIQQRDPGDGMVGYGLWQNTPNAWGAGSAAIGFLRMLGGIPALFNPVINAKMAKFLYQAAGNKTTPWYGTKYLGKSGGGIIDTVGNVLDALNPLDFIKDLPGADSLGWLAGLGKYAIGKIGSWIKDKVAGIFGGGGGGAAGDVHGLVPRVLKALAFARSHGWAGTVNSGYRSDAEQVAIWNSGIRPAAKPKSLGGPGSNHSMGEAVDISDIPGFARAMAMMPESERLYSLVPNDPVHFSVSGHANGTRGAGKGLAWVGERGPELVNFRGGEQVFTNSDSMRMAAQGLTVLNAYAKGAPTKGKGKPVGTPPKSGAAQQAAYYQKALDFYNATHTPPAKGLAGGGGGTVDVDAPAVVTAVEDSNQGLIDAVNELARLEQERIDLEKQRIDLENRLLAQTTASLNVSQSQYSVLAQAITEVVSRQMGSGLGLGLAGMRAPAGSVSRI